MHLFCKAGIDSARVHVPALPLLRKRYSVWASMIFYEWSQPAPDLHAPGNSKVNHQASPDTSCIITYNAQQQASPETADRFTHGFTEMDGAIKAGHGYDAMFPADLPQGKNKKAAEEELDADEIESIAKFEQDIPPGSWRYI